MKMTYGGSETDFAVPPPPLCSSSSKYKTELITLTNKRLFVIQPVRHLTCGSLSASGSCSGFMTVSWSGLQDSASLPAGF